MHIALRVILESSVQLQEIFANIILFTSLCAIAEILFANIILVTLQYPLQESIFYEYNM